MNKDNFTEEGCVRLVLGILAEAVSSKDKAFFESEKAVKLLDLIPNNILGKALTIDSKDMTSKHICAIILERMDKNKRNYRGTKNRLRVVK